MKFDGHYAQYTCKVAHRSRWTHTKTCGAFWERVSPRTLREINLRAILWVNLLSRNIKQNLLYKRSNLVLVYTTQVNSAFLGARRWFAKYYSPPCSRRKTKWLPVSNKVTLKQEKLLFGPLVIQLVWHILKQLFTSVSVKVVDIYVHFGPGPWNEVGPCLPPLSVSKPVNSLFNHGPVFSSNSWPYFSRKT